MEIKFDAENRVVSSKVVFSILSEVLQTEEEIDREKEHFWAIGLTAQNHIKYIDLVHLGAINQCPCHPMEIFRRACIKGIASLIVAHNHPAGNPEPSQEDRTATARLKEAGDILGIKFLDHIIIGKNRYFSFSDEGALPSGPVFFKKGGVPII
jgi:DNA repair protein RadC